MLTASWIEIISEIRADRGMLLGSNQYSELVGIDKAKSLDAIDERLKKAEDWLKRYADERVIGTSWRVRRWLREAARLTDEELEGA